MQGNGESASLLDRETDEIDLGDLITEGIRLCRREEWKGGLELLAKAARKKGRKEKLPSLYYSYMGYGVASFQGSPKEGLRLCRYAVRLDPKVAENCFNLARVCMLLRDRRGAVVAINRGLRVNPNHRGLRTLREEIGYRRDPVIPFLSRDNPLNRWLGRRRYEKQFDQEG